MRQAADDAAAADTQTTQIVLHKSTQLTACGISMSSEKRARKKKSTLQRAHLYRCRGGREVDVLVDQTQRACRALRSMIKCARARG